MMRIKVQRVPRREGLGLMHRALIGTGLFLVLLFVGVQLARAVEVIPSVGITRGMNGDDNAAKLGLANKF